METILITTTNNIENAKILKYCGVITTNVVIGVNFFSDFLASFSDFFGGNSATYQHKLDGIYKEIVSGLEYKAKKKGANAVIALHIDFDEISGKGKQMFMATAVGTACNIDFLERREFIQEDTVEVSDEAVEKLCMSRDIQKKLQDKGWIPKQRIWDYILTHNMPELSVPLTRNFLEIPYDSGLDYSENLQHYFRTLDYETASSTLYSFLENNEKIYPMIKSLRLFHPQNVLSYIEKGNIKMALALLETTKDTYNKKDLEIMETILDKLDNLPDKGKIESVVSGVFTKKEEEFYICPNGHKNNKEKEFCDKCDLNIKGLRASDINTINSFREKVSALKDLIENI